MALTVATPENLNKFARDLGKALAENSSSGEGGGGTSNYISIDTYISRDNLFGDSKPHLYLVVDSEVDMTDITLRYCRKGRTDCRRKTSASPHAEENHEALGKRNYRVHTTGWHQIWRLPLHEEKVPLIVPVLKSTTPDFVRDGNAYYEITVDGYDTMFDFMNDEEFDSTYKNTTVWYIMRKHGGICLVRDGIQISNFARFKAEISDKGTLDSIGI